MVVNAASYIRNMSQRLIRNYCRCFAVLISTIFIIVLLGFRLSSIQTPSSCDLLTQKKQQCAPNVNKTSEVTRPMIFIGGMPRSGTTLMRAILDSHPRVRCGEETRVVPRILSMRSAWQKSADEWYRLMAGGLSVSILDSAVRAFVYEILVHHSQYADVLCDKDPFILQYAKYITSIFPGAKFLFLVRDARAVIHSVMTHEVTITGYSLTNYRKNFKLWNADIEAMVDQCTQVGSDRCLIVRYEKLVLQPKKNIKKILKFLQLEWVDAVLHHEQLVGKKVSLSKTEHSSAQVVKPINIEGLTKWIGHLPNNIKKELNTLAPMLEKLGYDTESDVPSYGVADQHVLNNMDELKNNAVFWSAKAKSYARELLNITHLLNSTTIT